MNGMDANDDTVRSASELLKKSEEEFHPSSNGTEPHHFDTSKLQRRESRDRQSGCVPAVNGSQELVSSKMSKKRTKWKLKIFLGFLFIVIVGSLVAIYLLYNRKLHLDALGKRIYFDEHTRLLRVANVDKEFVLSGQLGLGIRDHRYPFDTSYSENRDSKLELLWKGHAHLTINYTLHNDTNCYHIVWKSLSEDVKPWDCYDLTGAYWYAGGMLASQTWPMHGTSISRAPFVIRSAEGGNESFGPILERYWLSSRGVALFVKDDSPLHVSINASRPDGNGTDNQLCLYSDYHHSPYHNLENKSLLLSYAICVDKDIKQAHSFVMDRFITKPQRSPDSSVFSRPLWSTWASFKNNIDQESLLNYSTTIKNDGYNNSIIVLDDGWQSSSGDLDFDTNKFPNPENMMEVFHQHGFSVYLHIHPFINTDSIWFHQAVNQDLLVHDASGLVPGMTRWKLGIAGVLDPTKRALNWFNVQLQNLTRRYNFDSVRFDGGEVDLLPFQPHFEVALANPNMYSTIYAQFVAGNWPYAHVGSCYHCQDLALLYRIYDKESSWSEVNGLRSVIPTVLTLGIMGYPFILPDVIGGSRSELTPDEELYIRWTELAAFLPVMHFSPIPNGNLAQTVAKKMMTLHQTFVVPKITQLVKSAVANLDPIIRPLWWISPKNHIAQKISSQFLIGDDVLVAPILHDGKRNRDIYIPEGVWEDKVNSGNILGPRWLHNYTVKLDEIAYFERK